MPSNDLKRSLRDKKNALIGKKSNESSPFSRFTEGRQTIEMRMRNLTFKRKRSYSRKQKWIT